MSYMKMLAQWCNKENKPFDIYSLMLDKYHDDREYWENQSFWKLYDAIR